MTTGRPKICLVSLYSYPLFNPACQTPFGGSEVRVSMIARELANRGKFDVAMVVFDHGQPHVERRENITLYSWRGYSCPLPAGLGDSEEEGGGTDGTPGLAGNHNDWARSRRRIAKQGALKALGPRSFRVLRRVIRRTRARTKHILSAARAPIRAVHGKVRELLYSIGRIGPYVVERSRVAVYQEVDADIYVLHGNSDLAAELALYCQQRGKKYVFLSGSDGDYHPNYKEQPEAIGIYGLPGYLLTFAIEHATVHIVQSSHQADLLRACYGRESVVVRSPIDLSSRAPGRPFRDEILWVGKSDWIKRPEIMLDLVRQFPEYHFTMVLNVSDRDIHARCVREAKGSRNLRLLEYVPYREIERYFAEAKLFVNTSVFEGFPNTFLQAAKYEVPIVSYQVDPGQMLSEHGCGLFCNGKFDLLSANVRILMTSPTRHAESSRCCRQYVRAFHNKDDIVEQYERILASV